MSAYKPLLEWTRPLKADERRAEREAEVFHIGEAFSLTATLPSWPPVLPDDVPQCGLCGVPHRDGLCAGCRKLRDALGWPVESVEVLTYSQRDDIPETIAWSWKEQLHVPWYRQELDRHLAVIGSYLARYLEAQAPRLFAGGAILTAVPSRGPLIATALAQVADEYDDLPLVLATGQKRGEWFQHTSGQPERLSRRSENWAIKVDCVRGSPVVLVDDVLVTGASLLSYAQALRDAGATAVRSIAVTRHMRHTNCDYYDALRIVRRTRDYTWSPHRVSVSYGYDTERHLTPSS